MAQFKARELDVLVATTVIEVGVDVPNATIMIVQEADRFGLAQLHQLRGRVGRGAEQSYCLLISRQREELTDNAQERLQALVDSTRRLRAGREDLELRGEGQLLGTRQAGVSDLHFVHWRADRPLLERARAAAEGLVDYEGPLAEEVERVFGDATRRLDAACSRADHRRLAQGRPHLRAEGSRHPADRRSRARGCLQPARPGAAEEATVLDLFAGSGAMGLEALRRGAAHATFVESDREACRTINRNLDKLALENATVLCQDALTALRADARAGTRYDLVLLDPPYRRFSSLQNAMISHLPEILAPGGTLLVETARRRGTRAAAAEADDPPLRSGPPDPLRRRVITAIYPGTYDPVTNGHVDVITRAAAIFDRVVIGVVGNPQHKAPMFTLDERVGFLRDTVGGIENVEVDVFSELVVDFAHKWDAKVIVKGLRVISDFEWEFQMNQLNRTLAPDVETVYVMASPQVSFVSSSGVKEIASFGGKVDELVPEPVARRFKELFPNGRPGTPENPQE